MSSAVSCSLPYRPAPPRHALRCRQKGDILIESLVCIAIVGLGAMPLAMLGSAWLRWGGQHERLNGTLLLAAEQAEAGVDGWPLISGDATRVERCDTALIDAGCVAGGRIALASLPPAPAAVAAGHTWAVTHIALWVRP